VGLSALIRDGGVHVLVQVIAGRYFESGVEDLRQLRL